HRLVVEHDGQEHRAFPMFANPGDRLIVDPLRDGRLICVRVPRRDSPPNDPLVFLHEDKPLLIKGPLLWREQKIVAHAKAALAASHKLGIAKRSWEVRAETLSSRGKHFRRQA